MSREETQPTPPRPDDSTGVRFVNAIKADLGEGTVSFIKHLKWWGGAALVLVLFGMGLGAAEHTWTTSKAFAAYGKQADAELDTERKRIDAELAARRILEHDFAEHRREENELSRRFGDLEIDVHFAAGQLAEIARATPGATRLAVPRHPIRPVIVPPTEP